jgi:hypothetical protein
MSSGATLKSQYIRAFVRPKFIRLLVVILSLIGLSRLIFKTLPTQESDYLHTSDLVNSISHGLPTWGLSAAQLNGSLDAMGRALHLSRSEHGKRTQVVLDSSHYKRVGEWCTEEEYLDGEWVLREEEVTLANIRKIYKYTDRGALKCLSKESAYGVDPEEDDPAHYERILETAQYEYRPRSGCKRHEWSRWNFAKYCLRTKAGCS